MTTVRAQLALAGTTLLLLAFLLVGLPTHSGAAELEGVVATAAFFKEFQDDAKVATEKYKGKRLVLQGEVGRVKMIFDNEPELIFDINPMHTIVCFFPHRAAKELRDLQPGTTVLVSGFLLRAETNSVILTRCQFVPAQ